MDLSDKKELVDSKLTTLSKTRETKLLGISRSILYCKPKPFSNTVLKILNRIDEIYVDNPEYDYRMIHQQLIKEGYYIGNNRVLKYMRVLGV